MRDRIGKFSRLNVLRFCDVQAAPGTSAVYTKEQISRNGLLNGAKPACGTCQDVEICT